jgi:DNA (cytosine-5)-methyltransferase 1
MMRIAEEIEPDSILIENVPGLISVDDGFVIKQIENKLSSLGYAVKFKVMNAADYGVPQHRKRLIIVGTRNEVEFEFPLPTHDGGPNPYVSAGTAIGDLDDGRIQRGSLSIGGKYGYLIDKIPEGMNYLFYTKEAGHPKPLFKWRSKYWHFLLKLARDRPSSTIQASPGPFVGPIHWRNRHLTLQEAKRLQTLPDRLRVIGTQHVAWQQIGNAVPPLLARTIGTELRIALDGVT